MSRSSRKCKHLNRRNIFGDEILQAMSAKTVRRQRCTDCGKALNLPTDPKGMQGEAFMDTDALLENIDEVLADCGTLKR